jgi:exonuclease SbcC
MERRVDAARRVAPVIAIVRAAEEAERTAENQVRLAEVSDAERASALGAHGAERLHLDAAELTAKELPALRDRIRQLDEVKGLVQARDSARGRLAKDRAERAGIADDLGDAERDAARARARAEAAEREVREAMARVERVGYDADVDAGLEAVRDIAVGLAALRPRAGELEAHAARVVGRAATAEAAARKRQAEAKSAGKRLGDAARALEDADRAVRDAEQTSVAALLREGLRVGAPCPVCGQAVTAASRVTALPQLEALRARRGRAGESEQQARQAATQAEAAAAAALATAQETRAAAENARAEGEAVAREISRREAELRLAIGQSLSSKSETGVEVLVQAAVQHVIELRRHHHQALAMQQQAEKRLHDARVAIEAVVHATESLRQRRDHLDDRIRESNADLSRLEGAIAMVTSAPDPLAEREDLAARHERLERDVLAARRTYQAAEARLAAATARAQAERQAAGDAARRAQRARQDAGRATRDAGFSDEVTARAAALPDAEVTRLASEADLFRRDLHAVAQRAADLFAELAGREVTDDALAAVEAESAHRERVAGEIRRELARLEIEAQSLAQRVDRAAELARQLGDRQRDHAVHRRLADDLRSERFQAFVLDESFRELAKGGSTRLMSLGGRYTFEYRDDSFYVVDHDNAGEQRSADTLSGGETFLASLALALELSEQVQSASAAVPLDSLFIDEGFGTLDPEALETVAGAIEGLPLGGRTVGIITHVPELAARLPARVIVEKRADGSRLRVEES